jgi:hypothetical protein
MVLVDVEHAQRAALRSARADADALTQQLGGRPLSVAFVATSYDTGFEPVAQQTEGKLEELAGIFPLTDGVRWTLTVVNDAPTARAAEFDDGVRSAQDRSALADHLRLERLPAAHDSAWGMKGRALRHGFEVLLDERPDVLVYLNLNLKVHAAQAASGLRRLVQDQLGAAIGSRAFADRGRSLGAGWLGRTKSQAWVEMVHGALPELLDFGDVSGPMKLLRREAAQVLVDEATVDGAGFDCEWLALLRSHGFELGRFPLLWVQREGSRPPFELVSEMVRELRNIRRAPWRRGVLPYRP